MPTTYGIAKKNLQFCEETSQLKNHTEEAFLELGSRLKKIKDGKLYEGRWDDFDHYCREELKMVDKTAYKLINIFETFVLKYNIPIEKLAQAGGWTTLSSLVSVIDNQEDADEGVDMAINAQSKKELKQWTREKKTGVKVDTCKHKQFEEYTIRKCLHCGDTWRVYADEK